MLQEHCPYMDILEHDQLKKKLKMSALGKIIYAVKTKEIIRLLATQLLQTSFS